jgi:CRP-like cAMP-binding protein
MKELLLSDEILEKIRKIPAFRFLTAEELDELVKVSKLIFYEPEEKIIQQGEVNQAIYATLSGNVKVTVRERKENEAYISTIGAGELFGEAGIFTEVKRTANVTAVEKSLLMELRRKSLIDFIRHHPRAGNKILMLIIYSLLKKLREVNQELAYERKADADQDDIDSIIRNFMD